MDLNEDFLKLYRLIEKTAINVFLTGKAGTGKTTFLKYLCEHSKKRMVVAAPTGVAAINAGGVTLHSLFQLSFEPFVPNRPRSEVYRFSKDKQNIIRSLDLLVIDEISMVRADVLDAVDDVLRFVRRNHAPFGGLQLLLIGDMQQLPPILTPQEEVLLNGIYRSSYFFNSKALELSGFKCVELKKIYRQTDSTFVDLLNSVRNNCLTTHQLEILNAHYLPGFEPKDADGFIHLTTHNNKARVVNEERLAAIKEEAYSFHANVVDVFPEHQYPTDASLVLKKGSQVMFVKNDPDKRFFNGKIGFVSSLSSNIVVTFPDNTSVNVPLMKWDNVQYELDPETKEIKEKVIGSFEQFPLRLAWAITIHKSQGLTFDKVLLDAGSAFAHGQVYVALSRCRSLEGLVLTSKLSASAIKTDEEVVEFSRQIDVRTVADEQIVEFERAYYMRLLLEQFDFSQLNGSLLSFNRIFADVLSHAYDNLSYLIKKQQLQFQEDVVAVSLKFQTQASELHKMNAGNLQERVSKASAYFLEKLETILGVIPSRLNVEVSRKDVKRRYKQLCDDFLLQLKIKRSTLSCSLENFSVEGYLKAKALASIDEEISASKQQKKKKVTKEKKEPKVPTVQLSYEMFRSGKSVEEIAVERGLKTETIKSHLIHYVASGELDIEELVPIERVRPIERYLDSHPDSHSLTEIREGLKNEYGFDEIKLVMALPKYRQS